MEEPASGFSFRVSGAGYRVQGSGFRVQGSGFRKLQARKDGGVTLARS